MLVMMGVITVALMLILIRWLGKLEGSAKTKKERLAARDYAVQQLLSITPSAIHIKFVWQHLVKYRQDKLDMFLLPKKSFRGMHLY